MSKILVIDASVAIKWFVKQEKGIEEAMEILDRIQQSPHLFSVPELFFNEMLAVLCRLLDDEIAIKRYLYILENLGFHRIGNGGELLKKAAEIALKYKLTGYDAVYASAADLINGTWITADAKAHERIAALEISSVL